MNLNPETRLSLIAKLGNLQDEEAWAEFVSIYQPVIQRFVAKYGLQYADAAEVTQEVLSGVVSSLDSWEGSRETSTFRGWLYRLTRNKAVDLIRKKARQAEFNLASNSTLGKLADPEIDSANSDFLSEFERQLFMWAVEKIKPRVKPVNWQAFWQTTIEDRPTEQVARNLNVDSSVVYVARSRIMKRLNGLVQKRLNESLHD